MAAPGVCPRCGEPAPTGARFCGACGSALDVVCPACGTQNPTGNRFCGACGSALDAEATASAPAVVNPAEQPDERPDERLEERKVVTSLFADLTASTELAARLDPEDLRAVLAPFFDAMHEEITRYGGIVEKFIGDAVVAFFGVPVAHEDDPERAVRAALAMQERLVALNRELSDRAGGDLMMRIGLNTGEVFAHGGGNDEGLVTGEAVNVAARFQVIAEPGRVVVGERTWRDTRHLVGFRELEQAHVKGIERPLRAFEVQGSIHSAGPVRPRAVEAPLVGRESEMELLRLLYGRTLRERRPHLVTIAGPPGIGKSRLAQELIEATAGDGAQLARGRCLPYGDGLTYWPLAEILRVDVGLLDSDAPEAIAEKAAMLAEDVGGEDANGTAAVLLRSIGAVLPGDPLAGADPAAAGRIIARAWQRYLDARLARAPMVAVIEDLHWADPRLLDLMETVLSRASGPAFVMCTARPELFERRPSWPGALSDGSTISLSPLSAREGATLVEHLLGGDAPDQVVGPVLHRSEGNPFFAGELLRMMMEDGTLAQRDGRWVLEQPVASALPDTVQGVIASRIDLLSPIEKRTIQDASVVGRIVWEGSLLRLGDGDAPAVNGALEGLVDKGHLREQEASSIEGERELIFHHVLTRDVAYASIPRSRRAQAHADVLAWIERAIGGRDEEFAEICAHHAERAGDARATTRWSLKAGDRLRRLFSADEAIRWYDRALEPASGDATLEGRAVLGRGRAHEIVGRAAEALEDYRLAGVLAAEGVDERLRAESVAAEAHALWLLDRFEEGQARLPEALQLAKAVGAADLEARLLYTAGTIRFGRGEFLESLELHRQALAVATTSGDLEGQALARHGSCETTFFLDPGEVSLEHGREADRLLRELGQRQMVAHNAYMVAWNLGFIGSWEEALETVDGSIAESREIGNGRDEAFALFARAEQLLRDCRLGEALADAGRGLGLVTSLDASRGVIIGLTLQSDITLEAWDVDGIVERSRRAWDISTSLDSRFQRPRLRAFCALGRLMQGERDAAQRWFDVAAREESSTLDRLWSLHTEMLAWEWSGDAEALDRVAAAISRASERRDVWTVWGPYALALAALLRGRGEDAFALAERCVVDGGALRERRLAWRAGRVAADALDLLGRPTEAATYRATARQIVEAAARDLPEPYRTGFLSRPDVGSLMGR